jgi:hypothetical protein
MRVLRRTVGRSVIPAGIALSLACASVAGQPSAERMTGVLARSHGALAFAPCEDVPLPATDRTNAGTATDVLDWLLDGHDGAIHVELDAWRDDTGWQLVHLRRAGQSEPGCAGDPIDYVWRAVGEGGWALLATPRSVTVSGADGLVQGRFPYAPFRRQPDGSYRYVADAAGEPVEIRLRPGLCLSNSGGSRGGSMTDYLATLSWRGREWEGCARNGKPR